MGVKEIWKVTTAPSYIAHTLGWPLPKDSYGGSFMYPMADDQIALGIVAGLDYRNAKLDVHLLLQNMKQHPLFKEMIEGGQCVEWGAKTIPEGGYHALPNQLSGDGVVMLGDAIGLVNESRSTAGRSRSEPTSRAQPYAKGVGLRVNSLLGCTKKRYRAG